MTLKSSPNLPRIVVVEDDPIQLLSLLDYLHLFGYPAWGADCSEVLYKGLMINPVDIISLDIGLPGEDGLTIAQHLCELPNIAIIILSARATLDDRIIGLATGADHYLVKPIDLAELVANIEEVTRNQSFLAAPPHNLVIEKLKPSTAWHLNSQHWTLTSAVPMNNRPTVPRSPVIFLLNHITVFTNQGVRAKKTLNPKPGLTRLCTH